MSHTHTNTYTNICHTHTNLKLVASPYLHRENKLLVRVFTEYKQKKKKKESLQHLLFPGGHPSKYWAGPTLLNFGDRTRTGAFSVVWP